MMDFTKIKKLTIGGVELKQLFVGGIQVWKSGYKNWVKYSTEADGVTIYNGGLGYKDGYRVRSGGAETTQAHATCTGYIRVKGGDIIRVSAGRGIYSGFVDGGVSSAINVYDASFTNLGQIVGNSPGSGIFGPGAAYAAYNSKSVVQKDNYWQWTVPPSGSKVTWIRVTGGTGSDYSGASHSELIVTINEEIE